MRTKKTGAFFVSAIAIFFLMVALPPRPASAVLEIEAKPILVAYASSNPPFKRIQVSDSQEQITPRKEVEAQTVLVTQPSSKEPIPHKRVSDSKPQVTARLEVEAGPVLVVPPSRKASSPETQTGGSKNQVKARQEIETKPIFATFTPQLEKTASAQPSSRELAMEQLMDCIRESKNKGVDWESVCSSQETETVEIAPREQKETKSPSRKSAKQFVGSQQDQDVLNRAQGRAATWWERPEAASGTGGAPEPTSLEAKFDFRSGRRRDNLVWSIAGQPSGCCPNVLSELEWTDLDSIVGKGKGELVLWDKFVFNGYMAYGDIASGDNRDSDYLGNNRTLEFSRSTNNGEGGDVMDAVGGFGYRFPIVDRDIQALFEMDRLYFVPLGGYSRHEQNLRISEGFQAIPATGSFAGLGSSYEAEWDGPWAGFEVNGSTSRIMGTLRFEWHWADYYAQANWNLRSDFQHPKSFEHVAEGTGLVLSLDGGWKLTDNWSLNVNVDYQNWSTDNGIDRVFFSSGSISETRLNEVEWDSLAIMGGFTFHFGLK